MDPQNTTTRAVASQPPMTTALLVWELGAGFTHLQNLLGVARHLRDMDIDCLVASADPRFDSVFRGIGCKTLQSYLWPVMRYDMALPTQRKARTFTDILANFGLLEPNNLAAMLSHYTTLFDLAKPDIVLCENAPGASLAARGRFPTILFGSTLMMLPPSLGDAFAPIDASSPEPAWPIAEILDALNAGLGSLALPRLNKINDVMDCAAIMPFGPSAFDPYSAFRKSTILSPHCPDLPAKNTLEKRSAIFVYLHEEAQYNKAIMETIMALPMGSRVYIQSLSEEWAARLKESGLETQNHKHALEDIARDAVCLLHHGGVTLTAAALAMAVPQIILARSKENEIAGRYVVERNLGRLHSMNTVSQEEFSQSLKEVIASDEMKEKASVDSDFFRAWFKDDPTYHVAREATKILNLPRPKRFIPDGGR